MKNAILSFCLFCLSAVAAVAQPAWKQGLADYQARDYAKARQEFLSIRRNDPVVYYNIACASYQLNDIGNAVLYFRKCLRLAPGDKAAQQNLELAESRIPGRIQRQRDIFLVRIWHSMTAPGMVNTWAILALLAFFVLLVAAFPRIFTIRRRVPVQFPLLTGVVVLVALSLSRSAFRTKHQPGEAVLMMREVPFYPAINAQKASASLPEGTTLQLMQLREPLSQVRLPDGRTGYISSRSFSII